PWARRGAGPAAPPPPPTPRPAKKRPPTPSPTRAPARDITREPLTRLIDGSTPPRDAAALKLAERAREELNEGTTENAFELLDTAIKNAPNVQPPYVLRARAYLAEGATTQARADLDKAAAISAPAPWVAEAAAVRGMMFELEGNRTEALAAYRRALRIFPGNVRARDALKRLTATDASREPAGAGPPP
ncbi:MAG: hypothetical protein AB1689_13460, partial [Thermodesulfobacteriota bacterium]